MVGCDRLLSEVSRKRWDIPADPLNGASEKNVIEKMSVGEGD